MYLGVTALNSFARQAIPNQSNTSFLIAASIILHPGLIIIDHIHFQYNGFLLGILLFSILAAKNVS